MKPRALRLLATALLLPIHAVAAGGAVAPATAECRPTDPPSGEAAEGAAPADAGWPREWTVDGWIVRVYQPQVADWKDFSTLRFYAAVSVAPQSDPLERRFGSIVLSADTSVAFDERMVVLTGMRMESLTFSDAPESEKPRLEGTVRAALPFDKALSVSLDRIVGAMDASTIRIPHVDVDLAPPRILASERPAALVIFVGAPRFQPVDGVAGLLFAINTNWDVFFVPKEKRYYLLDGGTWLEAPDAEKGPWTPARALPGEFNRLPDDENWSDVRAHLPLKPGDGEARAILVSTEPAELIVTDGAPQFTPIPGSDLMLVANAENDLVYDASAGTYYLLGAGRWFSAASLEGPWSAASDRLPDSFRAIPADGDAARLRVSVPGTAEATQAAILCSIPQKATVSRNEVAVTVTFEGPPRFEPIAGTTVQYAVNSPNAVFLAAGRYFCCFNGVWFTAVAPSGPWTLADQVPASIYTIPADSPFHYVTYVKVYEATPTTVVYGYTAGYSGATVAATGVVMFGLGIAAGIAIADDCCWGWHYHSCYFSYGCGAHWHWGCGGFICGGVQYGPYGGCGHWAAYNPATGRYSRGAFRYGPNGAVGYRTAYNPTTGIAGARATAVTPYGSWSRGVVTDGDRWVSGGRSSTARGDTGFARGSDGAGVVHRDSRFGNGTTVARTGDGDVFASRNGNVYRRDDDGWSKVGGDARRTTGADRPEAETLRNLQRDADARTRAERSVRQTQSFHSGGGWSGGSPRGAIGGGRPAVRRGGRR